MNRYFYVQVKYLSNYRFSLCQNQEIQQNQGAQDNAVVTEYLEVFALDIAHQEFDGKDGNHKSHNHAHQQCDNFRTRERKAEFQQLQQAGAEHDGDCHEERKFCGDFAVHAQKHGAQNGGAGTGGAGYHRKALKTADGKGFAQRHLVEILNAEVPLFVAVFQNDEKNAVKNQSYGNGLIVVKMLVQPIVQQKAQDNGGNTADDNSAPDGEGVFFLFFALFRRKRI